MKLFITIMFVILVVPDCWEKCAFVDFRRTNSPKNNLKWSVTLIIIKQG